MTEKQLATSRWFGLTTGSGYGCIEQPVTNLPIASTYEVENKYAKK